MNFTVDPLKHYKHIRIKKKNGGWRYLHIPGLELKTKQRNLLPLLEEFPLSTFVYGVKGRTLRDHAELHLDCNVILKMDVKNFFDTVTVGHFHHALSSFAKDQLISLSQMEAIAGTKDFVFLPNSHLPTGAPTSPRVANISFSPIDAELFDLAHNHAMIYTRYMDDLTFSGEKYPSGFQRKVNQCIRKHGFTLNHEKSSILYKNAHPQVVTGVRVSGPAPTIPRKYKRQLRAELDWQARYSTKLDDQLKGKLAYVSQIDKSLYSAFLKFFLKRAEKYHMAGK